MTDRGATGPANTPAVDLSLTPAQLELQARTRAFVRDVLQPLEAPPFPPMEYRITDATPLDANGRFWAINYFFPGDELLIPAADPLAEQYGEGPTHQARVQVERLALQRHLAGDGAPDIEAALKDPAAPQVQASASQDPFFMARRAVQVGVGILNGQKPASTVELLPSKLVTRDNVADYKGWTSDRSQ